MARLRFLLLPLAFGTAWAQNTSSAGNNLIPSVTVAASASPTACAVASAAAVSANASSANTAGLVLIDPSVALDCLQSVPVDVDNDIALINYLLPWFKMHSTIGYLKNPPKGYLIPGVDVLGGLVAIRQKLQNGAYQNQYQFTWDIAWLVDAVADGHLAFFPALNNVFAFTRTLNLVSISEDGLGLPKIYDINDLNKSQNDSYTASDVATIDGVPVVDYLVEMASLQRSQDPDASYNSLFSNIPLKAAGGGQGFVGTSLPALPDSHNVTFSNGTSVVYRNLAAVNQDFTGINTGDDLHTVVELGSPPDSSTSSTRLRRRELHRQKHKRQLLVRQDGGDGGDGGDGSTSTLTAGPGYPSPVAIHPGQQMSGYFLNDTDHMDTCVLAIYSFETKQEDAGSDDADPNAEYVESRTFARGFFKDCMDANRTKLVIDLSANGGGNLFDGFELYRNLFPKGRAYSGSTIRASGGWDIIGEQIWASNTDDNNNVFNNALNASGQPFANWEAFFGPQILPQDNVTNVMEYDLSNATTVNGPNGTFIVTGSDPSQPLPPQPFLPENIVVVTDGVCASTCTIFSGLLAREQGVRTIALGGRPLKQAMQYAGGVKGTQSMTFETLQQVVGDVIPKLDPKTIDQLNFTLPPTTPPPLTPAGVSQASINLRNGYAANSSADAPPLQFVYEAAHCRRFYKYEYLSDITAVWRDMADVAWKSAPCAPGSSVNPDGTMGNTVLGFDEAVVSTQSPYDGPGSLTNAEWKALVVNTTGIADILPPEPSAAMALAVNGKVVYLALAALVGGLMLL